MNKKKSNRIHERFKLSDDTVTTDKKTISENFNDFFVNIGNNLARKIPGVNTSPKQYLGEKIIHSIFLEMVTTEEINKIVGSLKKERRDMMRLPLIPCVYRWIFWMSLYAIYVTARW